VDPPNAYRDPSVIDVIVPVLQRPGNAQPLVDSLVASGADARITFIATSGDRAQIAACEATGCLTLIVGWAAGAGDFARKINWGFTHTTADLVFMGADDLDFHPRWDTIAARMMRGNIGVVATNDKANRQVMRGEFGTHCLISRAYIDEYGGTAEGTPGVVLHEGYDHNFVDRELCEVAASRKRYAFAAQSVVQHRHPLWRTADWDPTYHKALARFSEDQRLFVRRSRLWKSRHRDIVRR
jgi:hypothetical protein